MYVYIIFFTYNNIAMLFLYMAVYKSIKRCVECHSLTKLCIRLILTYFTVVISDRNLYCKFDYNNLYHNASSGMYVKQDQTRLKGTEALVNY